MHPGDVEIALCLDVCAHGSWHASDYDVGFHSVEQQGMLKFRKRPVEGGLAHMLDENAVADGLCELGERERMDEGVSYPADAEVLDLAEHEFKERSGGDDVEFRHVLVEVAKSGDCPRAHLDFVQKEKRLAWHDLFLQNALYLPDDTANVEVVLENSRKAPVLLEVQLDERLELLGEIADSRSLASLPRTTQQHGLAETVILPFKQG